LLPSVGLCVSSLVGVSLVTAGVVVVWMARAKQGQRAHKTKAVKSEYVSKKGELLLPDDSEFCEISDHLQRDLETHISERLKLVKFELGVKKADLEKKVERVLKEKEEELQLLEVKYREKRKETEEKFKERRKQMELEFQKEVSESKEAMMRLKILLTSTDESANELVETTRSELECPVCMEEMRPPRRIWQCSDGHAVCEFCRKKPQVTCCPTCRKYIVGRSTIAEKLARSLYGTDAREKSNEEESETKKITLSGYREVKIDRET